MPGTQLSHGRIEDKLYPCIWKTREAVAPG